jgi:hypothetical protein
MPKAGHLRPFPAVDHRFGEVVIAKLRREDVRSAGAGAVMTDQALASIDIATGRDGRRLADDGIGQPLLCLRERKRRRADEQSCEAEDEASAR